MIQIDVRFVNKSVSATPPGIKDIATLIKENEIKYDEKFEQVFKLANKGFSEGQIRFGRAALSNLLGGVG